MGARRCGLRLLERHDRRFVERLPVHEQPASSPAELANRMKALGEVLDGLVEDAAAFDPPRDAANATRGYLTRARRLLAVVRRFEAFVRRSSATVSPAGLRRHERALSRAWRETRLSYGRVGARPGAPPPPTTTTPTPARSWPSRRGHWRARSVHSLGRSEL